MYIILNLDSRLKCFDHPHKYIVLVEDGRVYILYKNMTNALAILRVLVVQLIERLPGVRKAVGSNPVMGSEFFLIIIGL